MTERKEYLEDYYWFWLCNIPRIGNKKIRAIMNIFESPKEVYNADAQLLGYVNGLTENDINSIIISKKDNQIYRDYIGMRDKNISFVHRQSQQYPERLKMIYDAPNCLYYKGHLPDGNRPAVSIIGSRECSNYGKEIARKFACELVAYGVQIISGMARGIDTFGHVGALNGGGSTYAVLGCGADICYPKENINIYMDMLENGGVLSEYPPKTQPFAGQFPMRNRIISGLSDAVIVIEARQKSGSLITVDQALEQNKDVMVVPGRIGDKLSEGCNNLIKLGAQMVTETSDILQNLNINTDNAYKKLSSTNDTVMDKGIPGSNNIVLATPEKMVYSGVDLFPKSINSIIEETGLDISLVTTQLLNLELKGLIQEISKNYYVRTNI